MEQKSNKNTNRDSDKGKRQNLNSNRELKPGQEILHD